MAEGRVTVSLEESAARTTCSWFKMEREPRRLLTVTAPFEWTEMEPIVASLFGETGKGFWMPEGISIGSPLNPPL